MSITTQQLQQALERAKTEPQSDYARELKRRLETGRFDKQLNEIGLERGRDGIKRKEPGFSERARGVIEQRGEGVAEAIRGEERFEGRSALGRGIGATSEAFSAVGDIAYEAAPKPIRKGIDWIGQKIGSGVQSVADKLGETKLFREAAMSGQTGNLERTLGAVSDLGNISAQVAGSAPMKSKPSRAHALPVEPEPMKGSRTVPPFGVTRRTSETGALLNKVPASVSRLGGRAVALTDTGRASLLNSVKNRTKVITDVAQDVLPTTKSLRDRQIAKAFKLTPKTDIARIEKMTGNDLGDWMGRNNLIRETGEETVEAINKFKRRNYDIVRDASTLVDETFTASDVPAFRPLAEKLRDSLKTLDSQEFRRELDIVENILNKERFDLMDVQYVKSLHDDMTSIFKRTGEVKDSLLMQDAANQGAELRRFIEDRVNEVYPDVDIRKINNNVQTAKELSDAIISNTGKFDTASAVGLGDYFTLGLGSQVAPGVGVGALVAKKVVESQPFRLRIAKWLDSKVKRSSDEITETDIAEIEDLLRTEMEKALELEF